MSAKRCVVLCVLWLDGQENELEHELDEDYDRQIQPFRVVEQGKLNYRVILHRITW